MIIRIEPKDWSMYTVLLHFDPRSPDAEDDVRAYLTENNLEPRRTFKRQAGDLELDVMAFGGCYLGRHHVQAISDIQRAVVQRELVEDAVRQLVASRPELDGTVGEVEILNVAEQVQANYAKDGAVFQQDENGEMTLNLKPDDIMARILEKTSA